MQLCMLSVRGPEKLWVCNALTQDVCDHAVLRVSMACKEHIGGYHRLHRHTNCCCCLALCVQFECLQELIQESGLQFQDTAILMNVMDQPVCDRASLCAAPVFGTLGHKDDPDLLLPVGAISNMGPWFV
jgi:hypothetical protein